VTGAALVLVGDAGESLILDSAHLLLVGVSGVRVGVRTTLAELVCSSVVRDALRTASAVLSQLAEVLNGVLLGTRRD